MRQELRKGKRDNRSLSDTPVSAAMAAQAAWPGPGGGLPLSSSVLAVGGEESALQDLHLHRLSAWKTIPKQTYHPSPDGFNRMQSVM